jgi:hypothetical protein
LSGGSRLTPRNANDYQSPPTADDRQESPIDCIARHAWFDALPTQVRKRIPVFHWGDNVAARIMPPRSVVDIRRHLPGLDVGM